MIFVVDKQADQRYLFSGEISCFLHRYIYSESMKINKVMPFCFMLLLWGCGARSVDAPLTSEVGNPLVDDGRWSALRDAIATNNMARLAQLLKKGVRLDVVSAHREDYRITPLILAAKEGRIAMFKMLVDKGADVHQTMSTGQSALHFAVEARRIDLVEHLVDLGVEVNTSSFFTESPMEIAEKDDMTEILRILKGQTTP